MAAQHCCRESLAAQPIQLRKQRVKIIKVLLCPASLKREAVLSHEPKEYVDGVAVSLPPVHLVSRVIFVANDVLGYALEQLFASVKVAHELGQVLLLAAPLSQLIIHWLHPAHGWREGRTVRAALAQVRP